jgi:hypothetical protein
MRGLSVLLILVATALAVLRLHGERGAAFQAVSHLYVGGLLGAWLAIWAALGFRRETAGESARFFHVAIVLSAVEVFAFLTSR